MTRDEFMRMLDEAIDTLDNEADCPDSDSGPVLRYVRDMLRSIRDHLIETDEQRRERFEAWFWWLLLRHKDAAELNGAHEAKRDAARQMTFVRDSDGSYGTYGVEEVWMAWQAALTWRGETKGGET